MNVMQEGQRPLPTWRNTPPFRADQVGSLLRTDRIKQARIQRAAGSISAGELRSTEDEEIRRIVEIQKNLGLEAVTDGEFRRAFWHFDFLEHLVGVEGYDGASGIDFHLAQTKSHSIKVTGKLDFGPHPMLEDFKFLKSVAGTHTAKMTIPSPSMLHYRGVIDERIYPDPEEFFADLAKTYARAIEAFYQAGCRYLQLDDTSWAYLCSDEQKEMLKTQGRDPKRLEQIYAQTINQAIAGRPADMKITMHVCRGNFQSTWIASGGYEPVAETLFGTVNVDGLFLEYDTERAGGFEPLRFVRRPDLEIVLGLVTTKSGELEDSSALMRRIGEASRYVPYEQLCLSPQCGFASTEEGNLLTEEQQWAKLRRIVETAHQVWK